MSAVNSSNMAKSFEPEKLASVSVHKKPDADAKTNDVHEYLARGPLSLLLSGLLIAVFTMAIDISIVATGKFSQENESLMC